MPMIPNPKGKDRIIRLTLKNKNVVLCKINTIHKFYSKPHPKIEWVYDGMFLPVSKYDLADMLDAYSLNKDFLR
jgi:hypothetical protein